MRPSTKQRRGIHTLKRGNCRASATVDHHPASSPPSLPPPTGHPREGMPGQLIPAELPALRTTTVPSAAAAFHHAENTVIDEWQVSCYGRGMISTGKGKNRRLFKILETANALTANTVLIKYLYHNSAFFNSICPITRTTQMQIKTSH